MTLFEFMKWMAELGVSGKVILQFARDYITIGMEHPPVNLEEWMITFEAWCEVSLEVLNHGK